LKPYELLPSASIINTECCYKISLTYKTAFRTLKPLKSKFLSIQFNFLHWYSNVLRGKRMKGAIDDTIPCLIKSDRAPVPCPKSSARLIQIIYDVDPPICPTCSGTIRIICLATIFLTYNSLVPHTLIAQKQVRIRKNQTEEYQIRTDGYQTVRFSVR
jgi:hypothetical protein